MTHPAVCFQKEENIDFNCDFAYEDWQEIEEKFFELLEELFQTRIKWPGNEISFTITANGRTGHLLKNGTAYINQAILKSAAGTSNRIRQATITLIAREIVIAAFLESVKQAFCLDMEEFKSNYPQTFQAICQTAECFNHTLERYWRPYKKLCRLERAIRDEDRFKFLQIYDDFSAQLSTELIIERHIGPLIRQLN